MRSLLRGFKKFLHSPLLSCTLSSSTKQETNMTPQEKYYDLMAMIETYANTVSDFEKKPWDRDKMQKLAKIHSELQEKVAEYTGN
ncbi:hypothetical protein [Escherichia phage UPEC06]|nr:hypothetical protein [Escherichia phage UPEC06]